MNSSITFRSVTPIFDFEMEDGHEFRHSGQLNDASFDVTLKKYLPGPEGFAELMEYANESQMEACRSIHMSPNGWGATEYFLVVDDTHSPTERVDTRGNSPESVLVHQAVISSLQLNTTKGIKRFNTYQFRSSPSRGSGTSSPIITAAPFSMLGPSPSILPSSAFENCRATSDVLMATWDRSLKVDRVLEFAFSYLEVIGTFLEPKHGFLLMMVIFEGLLKAPDEDTSIASRRIAQLVAEDKKERRVITRRFNQGDSSYRAIRNSIAHGDLSVESDDVKDSFPALYKSVIRAINKLVLMRTGVLDPNKDYYEEIDRVCRNRYASLPI